MRRNKNTIGFTLIEIVIVVAIITILTAMVVGIAGRINNQSKEQLTRGTLATISAALGQFADYGYNYKASGAIAEKKAFYQSLDFPVDCNNLPVNELRSELERVLGFTVGSGNVLIVEGSHKPGYSGSEALYFFLSRVPTSRKTLQKISKDLLTNDGSDGKPMVIVIGSMRYPLMRIIDPWGKPLRYDCYMDWDDYQNQYTGNINQYFDYVKKNKRTFPLITSAGADGRFGTGDDITNRD